MRYHGQTRIGRRCRAEENSRAQRPREGRVSRNEQDEREHRDLREESNLPQKRNYAHIGMVWGVAVGAVLMAILAAFGMVVYGPIVIAMGLVAGLGVGTLLQRRADQKTPELPEGVESTAEEVEEEKEEEPERVEVPLTEAEQIAQKVAGFTKTVAYRMSVDSESEPEYFGSRLGGVPYWDLEKPYPVTRDGRQLFLLAQIRLEDLEEGGPLPKTGLLQFFIAPDATFGRASDLNLMDDPDGFRVVWHEQVHPEYTREAVQEMGVYSSLDVTPEDGVFPLCGSAALRFEKTEVSMGPCDWHYEKLYRGAAGQLGITLPEDQPLYEFMPEDTFQKELSRNIGHWLLGYPYFVSVDPRALAPALDHRYNTMLLQLDSEMAEDGSWQLLWGRAGVANFFINYHDLRKGDFSRVMYTWDSEEEPQEEESAPQEEPAQE